MFWKRQSASADNPAKNGTIYIIPPVVNGVADKSNPMKSILRALIRSAVAPEQELLSENPPWISVTAKS